MSRNTGCYGGLYLVYFLIVSYGHARVAPGQQKRKLLIRIFPSCCRKRNLGGRRGCALPKELRPCSSVRSEVRGGMLKHPAKRRSAEKARSRQNIRLQM